MKTIPPCESLICEFKRGWSDTIKKEIVAFANTVGGDLFIGVGDDGSVVGVDDPDLMEQRVISMARDNIYPSIIPLLSLSRITKNGKTVVVVHVSEGSDKPYSADPSDVSTIYVRVGSVSMTASFAQISRFVEAANPVPWESRVSGNQDLTFEFCRQYADAKELMFNPVKDFHYGFVDPRSRQFTNLALLCSDQNPFGIKAVVFADDEKSAYVKAKDFSGSVFKTLKEAQDFILTACYICTEKPDDGTLERRERFSVRPQAVREALVNMIAHRDYSRTPPCVIHITPSEVVFFSVGGPAELTEEEILLQIATNCRNVRLAGFLKALKLMEGIGSGFSTIRKAYGNRPLAELIKVLDTSFLITLPRTQAREDIKTVSDSMALSSEVFSDSERAILEFLAKNGSAGRSTIEKTFGLPRTTANYQLKKLVDGQLIRKIGAGKNTRYAAYGSTDVKELRDWKAMCGK